MMPETLYKILMMMLMFGALLFVAAITYVFLAWAAGALWTLALCLIDEISRFLIISTIRICKLLKEISFLLLKILWEALKTYFLWIVVPPASWLSASITSFREYLELRRLYLKHGRKDFDNFADFKRKMMGDDEKEKKTGPQRSDYEHALDVLGFSINESFTLADLKQRYRQLLNAVHPDKGFQNRVFAQQINDAVITIKRERKWS
ncbi:MAG: J domain-containing protein [Telluria sp.]